MRAHFLACLESQEIAQFPTVRTDFAKSDEVNITKDVSSEMKWSIPRKSKSTKIRGYLQRKEKLKLTNRFEILDPNYTTATSVTHDLLSSKANLK